MTSKGNEIATKKSIPSMPGALKSDDSIGMGACMNSVGGGVPEDYRTNLCRLSFPSLLPVSGSSVFFKDFNVIFMYCYCPTHKKVALNKCQNAAPNCEFYSLPFTAYDEAHSIATIVEISTMSLFPSNDNPNDTKTVVKPPIKFQILRESQVLFLERTFKRLLLMVPIPEKTPDCCVNHDTMCWRTIDEALNDVKDDTFAGELKLLTIQMQNYLQTKTDLLAMIYEPIFENINHELTFDPNSTEGALLTECSISSDNCRQLYEDYHEHLYPSLVMTKAAYLTFLVKYNLVKNVNSLQDRRLIELWYLVSTFISKRQECFNFSSFLLSIAILDKNCPTKNVVRMKAIYEYQILKNKSTTFEKIYCLNLMAPESECMVEKVGDLKPVPPNKFADLDFTQYFRLDSFFTLQQTGIIKHIQNNRIISRCYHKIYHQNIPPKLERCVKHRIKKYVWAKQSLTVNENGQSNNPVPEPELPGVPDERTRIMNEFSLEILFNMQSLPNLLLRNITTNLTFSPEILIAPPTQVFKEAIDFQMIHELFQQVLAIFASEPKILQLSVPTTIFGSLSGSIFDLLQLEKIFFPPQYHVTSTLLFLGNYTSQLFEYPLETLVYLFALKCQLPNHVFLLRGVNETRANPYLMTQLSSQYGSSRSSVLYAQLYQIFDYLPYGAIVGEKIVCVHSGIPIVKKPILDVFRSDKLSVAQKDELLNQFIFNVPLAFAPKDTAKAVSSGNATLGFQVRPDKDINGYFYNHRATFRFLKQNGFERIIRSCNPCRDGFATMFQNGIITLASSSIRSPDFTAQHVGVIKLDSSKYKHKILILRMEALTQKNKSPSGVENSPRQ